MSTVTKTLKKTLLSSSVALLLLSGCDNGHHEMHQFADGREGYISSDGYWYVSTRSSTSVNAPSYGTFLRDRRATIEELKQLNDKDVTYVEVQQDE